MKRRHLLAALGAKAGALALIRERAAAGPNPKWAASMFPWTSTQWGDRAPVPFTDMLDVLKDTGYDGFRFVGWPEASPATTTTIWAPLAPAMAFAPDCTTSLKAS